MLNSSKIKEVDPTAYYISNFISSEEEDHLLCKIYSSPKPKWTQLFNRRLQNWGGIPHNKGMIAETIPTWLNTYLDKIHNLNLMEGERPNHVLVNEYLPLQGIMPHLDGDLFYPTITTISLGSHIVLKFWEPSDDHLKPVFSFLLEPRSLLVLQDRLFYHYLHGIEEVKEDEIDESVVNLDYCSKKYRRDTSQHLLGENMVSGQCMKVGEVLRALNGLTIQMECCWLLVWGCFTNNSKAWESVRQAGKESGDRGWRLPL